MPTDNSSVPDATPEKPGVASSGVEVTSEEQRLAMERLRCMIKANQSPSTPKVQAKRRLNVSDPPYSPVDTAQKESPQVATGTTTAPPAQVPPAQAPPAQAGTVASVISRVGVWMMWICEIIATCPYISDTILALIAFFCPFFEGVVPFVRLIHSGDHTRLFFMIMKNERGRQIAWKYLPYVIVFLLGVGLGYILQPVAPVSESCAGKHSQIEKAIFERTQKNNCSKMRIFATANNAVEYCRMSLESMEKIPSRTISDTYFCTVNDLPEEQCLDLFDKLQSTLLKPYNPELIALCSNNDWRRQYCDWKVPVNRQSLIVYLNMLEHLIKLHNDISFEVLKEFIEQDNLVIINSTDQDVVVSHLFYQEGLRPSRESAIYIQSVSNHTFMEEQKKEEAVRHALQLQMTRNWLDKGLGTFLSTLRIISPENAALIQTGHGLLKTSIQTTERLDSAAHHFGAWIVTKVRDFRGATFHQVYEVSIQLTCIEGVALHVNLAEDRLLQPTVTQPLIEAYNATRETKRRETEQKRKKAEEAEEEARQERERLQKKAEDIEKQAEQARKDQQEAVQKNEEARKTLQDAIALQAKAEKIKQLQEQQQQANEEARRKIQQADVLSEEKRTVHKKLEEARENEQRATQASALASLEATAPKAAPVDNLKGRQETLQVQNIVEDNVVQQQSQVPKDANFVPLQTETRIKSSSSYLQWEIYLTLLAGGVTLAALYNAYRTLTGALWIFQRILSFIVSMATTLTTGVKWSLEQPVNRQADQEKSTIKTTASPMKVTKNVTTVKASTVIQRTKSPTSGKSPAAPTVQTGVPTVQPSTAPTAAKPSTASRPRPPPRPAVTPSAPPFPAQNVQPPQV
jgi:hypothetical protein